jgi:hypothetical protein
MILRFDKSVQGVWEKIDGPSCPGALVGAYIDDMLGIKSEALDHGKKRFQAISGWGHASVRDVPTSDKLIAEFAQRRLN